MNTTIRTTTARLGLTLFFLLIAGFCATANATEAVAIPSGTTAGDPAIAGGQVTLPLDDYQKLLHLAATQSLPAPSDYALGQSLLNITYTQRDGQITATVIAEVEVEAFGKEWTLVPLLGPGAALESARIGGTAVQLVQRPEGLFWLAEGRQKGTVQLTYHVDARLHERAYVTSLPIPKASATRFAMRIPQTHIDLAVAPAANLATTDDGAGTTATGTVPVSHALMISWRLADERPYVLSRAEYSGVLQAATQTPGQGPNTAQAIEWRAAIDAELLIDGEVTVPLLSSESTLVDVRVDGEPATLFVDDFVDESGASRRFAVRVSGAGKHRIDLAFLSSVTTPDGVPSSTFDIPGVPVSRFELRLPGDKLLRAVPSRAPAASIDLAGEGETTLATFFIPLSDALSLNWMDAIPADIAVERRANAIVYQALHAAEGVLYGLAAIEYEITRGEANVLGFSLPARAQVNHVTSQAGAIADWVVLEAPEDTETAGSGESSPGRSHIRVFLNRAVSGVFELQVTYEQLLNEVIKGEEPSARPIDVPMINALGVSRQKGMVALLASAELALQPLAHQEMSEVGENQLPAAFRNRLQQAVSHTYKYHDAAAQLAVTTVTPERRQGQFNAQVDMLVSIGEVTLHGQVGVEADVKSGVLRELRLALPASLNVLGVTGPSIRNHEITLEGDRQFVDIEFTREMDGQFRIELNYERIMVDGAGKAVEEALVPRIEVIGADVEHGRIAIEALAALEVQPAHVDQLTSLEISELPRQLVLKTTNPILLAYKYVRTDQPFALELRITRHQEIDVQVAAIDSAHYETLFTTDGLAVTRVRFQVRNSRRQFLRLQLPEGSEVWSAFVDGQPQKPALASGSAADGRVAGASDVLIKMVNSATAFPVELVYATRSSGMDHFGAIEGRLPRPDMIVTRSNWDVYVPSEPRYGKPKTNMQVLVQGVMASVTEASTEILRGAVDNVAGGQPLHIDLPTQGRLFRFAKLYANQAVEDAHFSLSYVDRVARFAGLWTSLLATLVIWAGIVALGVTAGRPDYAPGLAQALGPQLPPHLPWALIVGGAVALALSLTLLGAGLLPPSLVSLAIAVGLGGWWLLRTRWR